MCRSKSIRFVGALLVSVLAFFELCLTAQAEYAWRWARRNPLLPGRRHGAALFREGHGGLGVPQTKGRKKM